MSLYLLSLHYALSSLMHINQSIKTKLYSRMMSQANHIEATVDIKFIYRITRIVAIYTESEL